MYIIYNKQTGKILHTINGKLNPSYLLGSDGYIEVNDNQILDLNELYIENNELITAQNRPSSAHRYSIDTKSWELIFPPTNHERVARQKRDELLAETDWRVAKATESGQTLDQAWIDYRQALRDITAQSGFPTDIIWPQKP